MPSLAADYSEARVGPETGLSEFASASTFTSPKEKLKYVLPFLSLPSAFIATLFFHPVPSQPPLSVSFAASFTLNH